MTKRIAATLPAATLAQRIAAMSTAELMCAALELAKHSDAASDSACTAVLETLEARTHGGAAFDAFVTEIFE